jgi:hypothetical protein
MQRKEFHPGLTGPIIPGTAVEYQLTLIYDNPGLMFPDLPTVILFMAGRTEIDQPFRGKVKVITFKEIAFLLKLSGRHRIIIDIKVGDDVTAVLEPEKYILCHMVAFPGSGRAGI